MSAIRPDGRVGILYLAPWVGYGGTDTGTIDWFRSLDRTRYAPYLVTTQPSANERLAEVEPYAEEVWVLPDFLAGQHMQSLIFDLIHTRGIGLVHVMNSRLGFELMADLAALPDPPAVVVQLHVEEHDRSGYVRLVSTRYGNLVDRFSVISEDLAAVVCGYGVAPEKIAVIPLGVDARGRFDPARVRAVDGLDPSRRHILHTGRLTAQKDPLLALAAIARVVPTHPDLQLQVVGEGELEREMRAYVHANDLSEHVAFHPMSPTPERWYAGCELLLMTSLFEGVPCVVYEAMAMGTPIVAPALPGNRELMSDTAGVLIDPRDDVESYAAALRRLLGDPQLRARLGAEARERVLAKFTVEAMAHGHAQLYEDVLRGTERRARCDNLALSQGGESELQIKPTIWPAATPEGAQPWGEPPSLGRLRFAERPLRDRPLVSAIVPCYNHGRYLQGCLESILSQDYPEVEAIVVDDASTQESTLAVLAELEQRAGVTVLRQPQNSGPSPARNRGIEAAQGRFILPVDADNLLLPGAIASMVEQLRTAGEQIGFIYPNCQYFGTRDDYFQPPSYNLHLLMRGNYCDTCSLVDRAVFDAGIRYPEDIVFGHEDWDFALTLAVRGIRGEPARKPTLRYRKEGFTRSDAVEYARRSFYDTIPPRHPELYGKGDPAARHGRYWYPAVDIKARWAPALSIVLGSPLELGEEAGCALLGRLERQTYRDFELVLECATLPQAPVRTQLRRLPPGLHTDFAARLGEGLRLARGRYLLVAGQGLVELATEPNFLERLIRTMLARPQLEAIALTDGGRVLAPHRLLTETEVRAPAHALFWELAVLARLPARLELEAGLEVESLARAMSVNEVALQWRHGSAPGASGPGDAPRPQDTWVELPKTTPPSDPHRAKERAMTREEDPVLPALPWNAVRRWLGLESWIPPETELLTRHREVGGERRIVRRGAKSPPGYELEFHLGAIQRFSPPGTARLVCGPDGDLRTVPRGSPRSEAEEDLGHLEQAPLPLLNPIERAVMPDGSVTLISTERDPLRSRAVETQWLGFIEGYPNEPVRPLDARFPTHGRAHLVRGIDREGRRHFYRAHRPGEEVDEQTLVGELGALHLTAEPGSIPVWIDRDGRVQTGGYRPAAAVPEIRELVRWIGAPAGWRGFGRASGRARAVLRRGSQAAAIGLAARRGHPTAPPNGTHGLAAPVAAEPPAGAELVGYLYPEPAPRRHELFGAVHPITGDQLLTLHPLEAADMGYGPAVALGYVLADLPLTGTLAMRRVAVPWASRFGLEVRHG